MLLFFKLILPLTYCVSAVLATSKAALTSDLDESTLSLASLLQQREVTPSEDVDTLQKRTTQSAPGTWNGCLWNVAGVGHFNSRINVSNWATTNFTDYFHASAGQGKPDREWVNTTLTNGHCTWWIRWEPTLIQTPWSDGDDLILLVPGGQTGRLASCAQFRTNWTDIMYGSVRTVAKTSNVPGTVMAAFFYSSDDSEADIEIQTVNASNVQWTNQGGPSVGDYVSSPWTTYHEYRLDWLPGKTMFYLDGVLKQTFTRGAPTTPGPWMWSNWFNDNFWTYGPPANDSEFHIKSIDMYVNRTSITKCGTKK